jgi:lipopolysaccharide biosynthesis glycosyltransferase
MLEQIYICCAADDDYSPHLGVMIYSLLKNTSEPESIFLFIIDGGIKKKNLKSIKDIIFKFHAKVEIISVNFSMNKFPICGHLGIATYYRIFFPNLLKDINKAIYLDCDLIILKDIKDLWNYRFNKIICAVKDIGAMDIFKNISKKNILLDYKLKTYFNAGVMIINFEKWREYKITEKILTFFQNYSNILIADQDSLNYCLKNQWSELDFRWNICPYDYYEPFAYIKRNIERKKYRYRLKHPYIVHFASNLKPWMANDIHPLKKFYYYYLNFTPWREKFPYGKKNYLFIILHYFRAHLPHFIRIKLERKLMLDKIFIKFLNRTRF